MQTGNIEDIKFSFTGPAIIGSGSGGDTYFVGLMSAFITALKLGFKPNVYLGVSASAIGILGLAMGMFDILLEKGSTIKPTDFFVKGKHPVKKNGQFNPAAIFRIIFGANSMGEQDVTPLLEEVYTEDVWQEYINGDYPDCIVFGVDADSGSVQCWNLKQFTCRYDAFAAIRKSSKIAPIVAPEYEYNEKGKKVRALLDGGFRVHNALGYFLRKTKHRLEVKEAFSVYSRPEDYKVVRNNSYKNFVTLTTRVIEIATIEVSKGNEREEIEEMKERGLSDSHNIVFLPKVIKSHYGTDPDELKLLASEAERLTRLIYTDKRPSV